MHVQGQVGILVDVPFVLPNTLSGPQVPQLDLWEEAQGTVREGPTGTLVKPRHEAREGEVVSKDLFKLENMSQTPEPQSPSKAP